MTPPSRFVRKVKLMPTPEETEQWSLPRSQERERQLAILRLPHEELVAKLWQRVMIPDALVPAALDMSEAYWQHLKASGKAPPRLTINGLRYLVVADLRAWVDAQPKTMAIKERRRGKRSTTVNDNETTIASALVSADQEEAGK